MKPQILLIPLIVLLLLSCTAVSNNTFRGLPLHVEKIGDNAIRLWVGDYVSSTAVAALNTDKGIVVIDTTQCPSLDKHFRKVIAKEFDRDDFVYLINTHEHGDHTTGNGVYADCTIIAHDACAAGMKARQGDGPRITEWHRNRIPELEAELAALKPDSDEYKQIHEDVIVKKLVLESLELGTEPTFPTKTFDDTMKLDLGNMSVELYAMGGTHTPSDIFVFVPEEGLLFTGDMMADVWLTDTPGCLQAFRMQQGTPRDIPKLLYNWEALIARKDEIRDYIPAHWNGDLTEKGFIDRYEYVKTLHEGIAGSIENGSKLDEMFVEFNLQQKFPHLAGTPGFARELDHYGSIAALWTDITGAVSAGEALAGLIEKEGLDAAVDAIRKAHSEGTNEYYFLENDFNRLGYDYLNKEQYDEAIAVFRMNVDMYPESWNVYDSLGEAYMKSGSLELAVNHYNRSLELNPDNDHGKQMLEEMSTVLAQK